MSWLRRDPEDDARARERKLVARMLAGEETAFESFSSLYTPPLYRFALRALGEGESTREIVQATLCKAIAQLRSFRGEAGLATWLCAIGRNEIAAHFRRKRRMVQEVELPEEGDAARPSSDSVPVERSPDPEQALLQRERARLVHQALDLLPPHYGRALEWKYLDHLSVEEIARRLELGPKGAESTLTRARQAFRAAFARLLAGEEREDAREDGVRWRRESAEAGTRGAPRRAGGS